MRSNHEEGFTLIELMVVVLIIAILLAIAIPTFLGARERAQDRAAQSNLRNTLTAAQTIYTDDERFLSATTTALAAAEPTLTFTTNALTHSATDHQNTISVASTQDTFIAAVRSKSGRCYFIRAVLPAIGAGATPGSGNGLFLGFAGASNSCQASTTMSPNVTGDNFADALGGS